MKNMACSMLIVLLVLSFIGVSAAQDQSIFGDYLLIPGERLGVIQLGWTRQEIVSRFGQSQAVPAANYPYRWDWPERGLGTIEAWQEKAARIGFCQSNGRVFFAGGSFVNPSVPTSGITAAQLGRMRTPEDVNVGSKLAQVEELYGAPISRLNHMGGTGYSLLLYANGLALNTTQENRTLLLGAYNVGVCKGESIGGTYVPFLGRVTRIRVETSRVGDPEASTIGAEAREFRFNEPVYVAMTLEFPPIARPGGVLAFVGRKMVNPRGQTFEGPQYTKRYTVERGKTSLTDVWKIGTPRPAEGEFIVTFTVNGVELTKTTFMNLP